MMKSQKAHILERRKLERQGDYTEQVVPDPGTLKDIVCKVDKIRNRAVDYMVSNPCNYSPHPC